MAYNIKYTSKDQFYNEAARKFNSWTAQLIYTQNTLNQISALQEFQGASADAVKAYFDEVHGLLLRSIRQTIEDFYCRLSLFVYGYYDIDQSVSAVLPEEALLAVKGLITDEEAYLSEEISSITNTLNTIRDILNLSTPYTDNIFGSMADLKGQIDSLGTSISDYERTKTTEATGELATLINSLSAAINSCVRSGASISGYQSGGYNSDPAMQDLSQNVAVSAQNTSGFKASINDILAEIGSISAGEGPDDLLPPDISGVNDLTGRQHVTMADLINSGKIPALLGAILGDVGITTISGSGVSEKTDTSIKAALLYGQTDVEYDLFGMDVKDTYYGDLIGGSASYKVDSGFSLKADEDNNFDWANSKVKVGIEGKAEGHVATGEISSSSEYLNGKAAATFVSGGVKGGAGISIIDGGKFTPSIYAEASAEASVLEGEAELSIGDQNNNIHGKAEGTLLGAEASAEGAAGRIKIKDKATGQETTAYGIKGEVKAEAYLAEGEVSGGFELFGVKIDLGVEGKAGGAGVGAGGHVSTGGVSGEVDLGLGVGIGLNISIDWSGIDFPW